MDEYDLRRDNDDPDNVAECPHCKGLVPRPQICGRVICPTCRWAIQFGHDTEMGQYIDGVDPPESNLPA